MSLLSKYQARYSVQLRRGWSNPQLSTATTPNTTNETQAATDAQADFEAVCGVTYNDTNDTHGAAAVPLVASKLMVYMGHADETYYEKALKRCLDIYRLVLGRNRIVPTSNSKMVPTEEPLGSLPFSDLGVFPKYIGNAPSSAEPTIPKD